VLKAYIIPPLLALAAFVCVYHGFNAKHEARQFAAAQAARAAREARIAGEHAAREQAIRETRELQARRKREREEREALDLRDRTLRETERLARQIERLDKEIAAEEAAVASLADAQKRTAGERDFVLQYTAAAESGVQELQKLLDTIAAAETALARAAADAAQGQQPSPPRR
jgi:hypothetical protein